MGGSPWSFGVETTGAGEGSANCYADSNVNDDEPQARPIAWTKPPATKHVGVIAWSREANPAIGEYGPPTTLFQSGEVPDME